MKRFTVPLFLLLLALGQLLSSSPASANAPENAVTADALPTWQADGTVWAMASSGRLVFAGGDFTQLRAPGKAVGAAGSVTRTDLAVLDGATGKPTSCTLNVSRGSETAYVRALAVSPNGATLYVGGIFSTIKGVERKNVAAVDIASCTVLPFNPRPTSFVYAITATSNKVYLGGAFLNIGSTPRTRLAALNLNGSLITSWAPAADDDILALNTDPNTGNVIVGGQHNRINGTLSPTLAVVGGTSGSLIKAYPANFFPWTDGRGTQRPGMSTVKSIAVDSAGFYIGNECNCAQNDNFEGRAAFSWGSYNQKWRDRCSGATQSIVIYGPTLFSASHVHDCSSEGWFKEGPRRHFMSESTADKKIRPWFPQSNGGTGEGVGPRALAVARDDTSVYLWAGGEFTTINGKAQQSLTRFGPTPDVGNPARVGKPKATTAKKKGVTLKWRASRDADDAVLTYRVYRSYKGKAKRISSVKATSYFWSRPTVRLRDAKAKRGKTYTYWVRAVDAAGNASKASPKVKIKSR